MTAKKPSMLDEIKGTPVKADIPVGPDLTSRMQIELAVNRESEVWVLHNQPFPSVLEWIEYDVEGGRVTFITRGGKLNDLGVAIGPAMGRYLKAAKKASAFLIFENKIHDFAQVPVVVRDMV